MHDRPAKLGSGPEPSVLSGKKPKSAAEIKQLLGNILEASNEIVKIRAGRKLVPYDLGAVQIYSLD